jgi:hypothetical protein
MSILLNKESRRTLALAEKPIIAEFEPTFLKWKGKRSNSLLGLGSGSSSSNTLPEDV